MSSATSALIAAFLGIAGTLASALLTQRSANNSKMREIDRADLERREDREYEAQQSAIAARRTCYVALNTAARLYQTELTNYLRALDGNRTTDALRDQVEEARREHQARHAEAQMVLPDVVLAAAGAVNSRFRKLYGILRRLDLGSPEPGETKEQAERMRQISWDLLGEMRAAMRSDLNVI